MLRVFQAILLVAVLTPVTATAQDLKPYLLVISIDGMRWDYLDVHQPTNLLAFAQHSAQVKHLIPAYPSKTFPNHYSLVTGLYPQHHGIVGNRFYSPELGREYNMRDARTVTDGKFYGGVPIWSLAEQQGLKSAVYFWPGSEAEIAGERPSYYKKYSSKVSSSKRIKQVIDWFELPENERPQYVSVYFSSVDSVGHSNGPFHPRTGKTLRKLDVRIGQLLAEIETLPMAVNVIITSDHGMRSLVDMPKVLIDRRLGAWRKARASFRVIGNGSLIQFYHQGGGDKTAELAKLRSVLDGFDDSQFYTREEIPAELNFSEHSAIGDAVLMSNSHYLTYRDAKPAPAGGHGFDPNIDPDMHTLLLASGPAFQPQVVVDSADNVDLYPLMAQILGLTIEQPIDGELKILRPLLKPD
ncbi:ectonucleotide pyrophosphatase/phosphodiesterase [Ferrimonas lipolytica]|uniref:Alkaline phosphatase family protein n=1 Tax=Ferrimonas lipolytica TaxID=2724191 RepID=A0A6H1UBC3_9GAMM|nr:ectonucleotide pyrophosphatase/phosphodiesterase [Ferrimonas lipolytica]QIZ76138.1 alkaline phosphatase family protein [Ferrimonas lipolytica]